ncbi:MAG: DinB family protein [Clostridiales bacterium]|jgi:hypothetical protein|nr:DinB family protein [Clostridiales bacterium]
MAGSELVRTIQTQTTYLFDNAKIMLQTCNTDYILCGFPIWKHVYHMLHSCDRWFINPSHYAEPDFHEPDMNSLDIMTEKVLSREDLLRYLESVREKVMNYLAALTDEDLCENPPDCTVNRLSLILAQYRHFYAHLGNINATTIIETNEWPRVVGKPVKSGRLYE